jgi:hypothetical protein
MTNILLAGNGKQCRTCAHLHAPGGTAAIYYKCGLVQATGGPATDMRVRWPACERYEEDTEEDDE